MFLQPTTSLHLYNPQQVQRSKLDSNSLNMGLIYLSPDHFTYTPQQMHSRLFDVHRYLDSIRGEQLLQDHSRLRYFRRNPHLNPMPTQSSRETFDQRTLEQQINMSSTTSKLIQKKTNIEEREKILRYILTSFICKR